MKRQPHRQRALVRVTPDAPAPESAPKPERDSSEKKKPQQRRGDRRPNQHESEPQSLLAKIGVPLVCSSAAEEDKKKSQPLSIQQK